MSPLELGTRINMLARVSSNLAVIVSVGLIAAMRSCETVIPSKNMNREAEESTLSVNFY
jgi:hypothetical protein